MSIEGTAESRVEINRNHLKKLTIEQLGALRALENVRSKILSPAYSNLVLELIPEPNKENKERSVETVSKARENAKRVLGQLLRSSSLEISDRELNALIERYNKAQATKFDKCKQSILDRDVATLQQRLTNLYADTEARNEGMSFSYTPEYTVDEIVGLISDSPNSTKEKTDSLIKNYKNHPLSKIILETPTLREKTVPLSSITESGVYFVPELGTTVIINLEEKTLELDFISLPLNIDLKVIKMDRIFGSEPSQEVDQSRMDIFKKLAEKKLVILTHETFSQEKLLQIINSAKFGFGDKVDRNFVEAFNFSEQDAQTVMADLFNNHTFGENSTYPDLFKQLTPNSIIPNGYRNIGGSSSSHLPRYIPSAYIKHGNRVPIFIFDAHKMKEKLFVERYPAIRTTPFSHEGLLHILVTPEYRTNLLAWINAWPEEKKKQIFGDKDVNSLFISQADQIP